MFWWPRVNMVTGYWDIGTKLSPQSFLFYCTLWSQDPYSRKLLCHLHHHHAASSSVIFYQQTSMCDELGLFFLSIHVYVFQRYWHHYWSDLFQNWHRTSWISCQGMGHSEILILWKIQYGYPGMDLDSTCILAHYDQRQPLRLTE